jgi:hypothetical protein
LHGIYLLALLILGDVPEVRGDIGKDNLMKKQTKYG